MGRVASRIGLAHCLVSVAALPSASSQLRCPQDLSQVLHPVESCRVTILSYSVTQHTIFAGFLRHSYRKQTPRGNECYARKLDLKFRSSSVYEF